MTLRVTQASGQPSTVRVTPPVGRSERPARFGDFLDRTASSRAPAVHQGTPSPSVTRMPAAGRADPMEPWSRAGRQLLSRVARGERYVENVIRQALSGRAFTPADLLALQAQVYRYTQELELVSKLVDRAGSSLRTILQQGG